MPAPLTGPRMLGHHGDGAQRMSGPIPVRLDNVVIKVFVKEM